VTGALEDRNTVLALAVAKRACVIENGAIALGGPARYLARHPRVREASLGA
jgi:ABC-type branched-subunit amino acid transport system ATPase component